GIGEANRFDNQAIAFPVTHGIAVPRLRGDVDQVVSAPVGRDDAELAGAVHQHHEGLVIEGEDLGWRAEAGNTIRPAVLRGILKVAVVLGIDHGIPELGLVLRRLRGRRRSWSGRAVVASLTEEAAVGLEADEAVA